MAMRFFRKNDGAVSVFLVIILVPMLVVTSLFVDVARLHLGQAMIDSAGDLTLNTAMTEFDEKLNDYFGLLGTCKSDDELKKVSEKFYKDSLKSAGLSKKDSDDLIKKLTAKWGEDPGNISDLMNLELVDQSFSMKRVANSGFNNPAVVKTQVVNFMKYRSPINGALHLLDSLKEVSDVAGNSKEETELIAEKKEMAEAENTLMGDLKKIYDNLKAYESLDAGSGMKLANTAGMKKIVAEINGYRNELYSCAEEAVINFLYLDIDEAKPFTPKEVKKGSKKKMFVSKAFEEIDKTLQKYVEKRDALDNACGNQNNTGNELRDGLVKAIQVPKCYNEYRDTAGKLSGLYESMKDAFEAISNQGDVYPYSFETLNHKTLTYQETFERFEALYKLYEKDFDKNGSNDHCYYYNVLHNQVEGVGTAKLNELKAKYNQKKSELDGRISGLANTYKNIAGNVGTAIGELQTAKEALDRISGGELKDFLDKNDTWKEHAEKLEAKGSEIGHTDVEMYKGPKEKDGALTDAGIIQGIEEKVTAQNVMILRKHAGAIQSHLKEVQSKLGKMKFGEDLVGDVSSVDKVNEKFRSKISKDEFEQNMADINALKHLAEINFNELYKDTSGNLSDSWISAAESTPVVSGDTIYKWLREEVFKKEYDESSEEDYKKKYKDKSKDQVKDSEETKVEGLAEKYKVSDNKIKASGKGKLPSSEEVSPSPENELNSGEKSDDIKKASETIGSFFSGIFNALKVMATGVRDDLYTVDYIMSMFSYDTFVNEGLYDVAKANGKSVDTLLKTRMSIGDSGVIQAWSNESTLNTANKSLTNKEISRTNQYAFGKEVEYILYGEGKENTAYTTIFAIRLGLNSLYGFKEFWNDTAVAGAASAISTATCGVVSPALVKLAIILALVVAETVYDISCLKAGMPVVIMKSDKTWQMKLSKIFSDLSDSPHASSSESGKKELSLRYSDYLKIFLMVSMTLGNENKIYTRLADVIQCNMAKITGKDDYSMSNCKTWFTVSSRVYVKPLMLDLPWTKDAEGNPKDDTSWYTLSYNRSGGYY